MNKTFRSVWNASKQAYVAAAENVSAKGKPSSAAKLMTALAGLMGVLVVLRQRDGQWHIQDSAVWSGSTAPWHAAHFVRHYLQKQSTDLPSALLHCVPIDAARYAAQTTVSAS